MFSLVLKVPGAMASSLVFLQYLFALAVVEALQSHVKLCLKWPNDIYADLGTSDINRYRKVGGVLVNTLYAKGQFQAVIGSSCCSPKCQPHHPSGCGLNVENQRPTLSLNQLASLQNPGAEHFGLETALALILNCFDQMWDQFRQEQSFAPFLERYLSNWIHRCACFWLQIKG
jgi:biotin--protein ligase